MRGSDERRVHFKWREKRNRERKRKKREKVGRKKERVRWADKRFK